MADPGDPPLRRAWLRRLVPWLATAGVVAFLLHRYPLARIAREIGQGDALAMVPFALVGGVATLFLICGCDALVLRAALGGPRYRDVLRGKAGTSLLMALGYGFGHGGYGLWLGRRTGTDVRTTFGVVVYVMLSDLAAVCVVAAIALVAGADYLPERARGALMLIAPLLGGALISLPLLGPRTLARWVADPKVLRPWSTVPARVYALSLLGRCGNLAALIAATWAGATAFGLEIPVGAMFTYLPLVMLVGSLPINVAGFGAVQAAWLVFEPWAPGAQILAFQFVWHAMMTAVLFARGAPFVRWVARDIEAGAPAASRAKSPT